MEAEPEIYDEIAESSIDLSQPINESLYQKREDQGNEILWRIINVNLNFKNRE